MTSKETVDKLDKDMVSAVRITVEVGEHMHFFLLLARDGSINRTGPIEPGTESDLFIGVTRENLFDQLMTDVPEEFFECLGRSYELPDQKGDPCKLTFVFDCEDCEPAGIQFKYGNETYGLPVDVSDLVKKAMKLTDPWYEKQIKMVAGTGE